MRSQHWEVLIMVNKQIGETLVRLRKVAKVSQGELGRALQLHQTAVSRVEQGQQQLTAEQVDYWQLAESFGQIPPFPKAYLKPPYSQIREILPLLEFARRSTPAKFVDEVVHSLGIDPEYLKNLDQKIGHQLYPDLLRILIEKGIVNVNSFGQIAEIGRRPEILGPLHGVFSLAKTSDALIELWGTIAGMYSSNMKVRVNASEPHHLTMLISSEVKANDPVIQDFPCLLHKAWVMDLPRLIGAASAKLTEKQCQFHGHDECIYSIVTA
jgi:transcriptional regulator with XRE-family HTH domain